MVLCHAPVRFLFGAALAWCALSCGVLGPRVLLAEESKPAENKGEAIYKAQCASCHGAAGEGTKDAYPHPLLGDKSVAELALLIDKTMPEGEAEKCVGEDAKAVAAYIHESFYSPLAQARNKPARIELSRLTVRQYQNSLADLIGSFRNTASWNNERGLKAEYFKGRRMGGGDKVISRVDPQVKFDFGEASPEPEKIEPHEFGIQWQGSVLAPDSGDYEFIVRTEHATRLWVNDQRVALIDAWVKSGNDTEYRGTLRLLGGRAYPIRLDFSKAKQGVDDSKKNKEKPKVKASISLSWKRPQLPEEIIPERCLTPQRFPETYVVTTPFPPDDRSVGYERGTAISKEWEQATTDAAIETADYVLAHVGELSGAGAGGGRRRGGGGEGAASIPEEKLREFCVRFAERAFRRPLSDEVKALVVDRQFAEAKDPELALKRSILLALKSPRFLYREIGSERPDAYDVAARIAFGLWDAPPDQKLLEAAKANQLSTREQVVQQIERMLPDLRTHAKLRDFFLQWLRIDQVPDLSKDPEKFPQFDQQITADLRTSLELFVEEIAWSETSDFRRLLNAQEVPLNGRLAKFYGISLPEDAPFQNVSFEADQRAGALTHPYLLAGFAYTQESSPIHRGVFIARSVLGRFLRPPPEAVAPLAPNLHPGLTTRERVILQTKANACNTCHNMINPLGFTLEKFDAVGRYRSEEKGKPVDASGSYVTRSGEKVNFGGVRELASFLADSDETHAAFVEQLFQYFIKQPIRAYGPEEHGRLKTSFVSNQFHIRKLMTEIVADAALANPSK
jgi:mono/diheme cytochrome c family protein